MHELDFMYLCIGRQRCRRAWSLVEVLCQSHIFDTPDIPLSSLDRRSFTSH